MFSGLVDHCGRVVSITLDRSGSVIVIQSSFTAIMLGESIAVDGVCLTVVDFKKNLIELRH